METDIVKLKRNFGWSEDREEEFLEERPEIRKGSFTIKKSPTRKNGKIIHTKYLWYFKYSSSIGKRDEYLTKVDDKKPKESFRRAKKILVEKTKYGSVLTQNTLPITRYIDEFTNPINGVLQDEVKRGYKSYKTADRIRRSLNIFEDWSLEKGIKLNVVPKQELVEVIKEYATHLSKRNKLKPSRDEDGNTIFQGLSNQTIKIYIQDLSFYFDWLCSVGKDYDESGKGIFKNHHLTIDKRSSLLKKILIKQPTKALPEFNNDWYELVYKSCKKQVREIWGEYCRNEFNSKIGYRNKFGVWHQNHTNRFIGKDIVYFVTLIQLRIGARVAEILHALRSRDIFDSFNTNEMYSCFGDEGGEYYLEIKNSKGNDRRVAITDTIRNWKQPPPIDPSLYKHNTNVKGESYYDTNIVEVIRHLFYPHSSMYLFPIANNKDLRKPRSYSNYSNNFKLISNMNDWGKYGIKTTHDIRQFFISYCIYKDIPPELTARISGNKISTIEKHYLRRNSQANKKIFTEVIKEKDLHKINLDLDER